MKKHILLVDDEPAILYTLSFVLKHAGYRVTQARDGREALTAILKTRKKNCPFDLLLTDIQMPKMTGIELIDELNRRRISLPVFVVSGLDDANLRKRLRRSGCSDFLVKPYDFREIVKRIHRTLRRPDLRLAHRSKSTSAAVTP
jgi:two-component system alkaline phosphatase synthesis response regulator PhoP